MLIDASSGPLTRQLVLRWFGASLKAIETATWAGLSGLMVSSLGRWSWKEIARI